MSYVCCTVHALFKFDELVAVSSAGHPDIVCLVKTWLSVDSEVFISIVRLDRNRHVGVLVYAHTSITCNVLLCGHAS